MSVTASPVVAQNSPTHPAELREGDTRGFEERWAAWHARGAAHDRGVRGRMMVALPILAIVAAVLYVLLVR